MWDLIVSVPDHGLSSYFVSDENSVESTCITYGLFHFTKTDQP